MSPNTLSNWHWVGESGSDGLLTPGTNVRLVQPIVTGDRAHMGSEVAPPRAKRNSEKILFSAAELPRQVHPFIAIHLRHAPHHIPKRIRRRDKLP